MKKQKQTFNDMKTVNYLILCLTAFAFSPAFAQQPMSSRPGFSDRIQNIVKKAPETTEEQKLTKFDLDFPGGTPKQLISAIEKAMGKPVNAIIPDEYAAVQLPSLKLSNVNISELFKALGMAASKTGYTRQGNTYPIGCGFRTDGEPSSDDSIWYFFKYDRPPQVNVCRYYSLAPYLERGTTVDDITTAIQTGWKMLGDKETPTINFHKDTKLLIAVGEPEKLATIDAVLQALNQVPTRQPMVTAPRVPGRPSSPTPKSRN